MSPSGSPSGWSREEARVLARLRRPEDVQRFVDELPYNREAGGETCRSPRRVLRERTAHCLEGAFFAAAAFRFHGRRPLVLQMQAVKDEDHMLALFRERADGGAWGAVAKSKFVGLRFREPVYRTLRELAMSYFEPYCNLRAEKTLRGITGAIDLSRFDARNWERAEDDLWDVSAHVAERPLKPLLTPAQVRGLRRVDRVLFESQFLPELWPNRFSRG